MMPGGTLASFFGWLVGTGTGSGMSLIILAAGLIGTFTSLGSYVFNSVRNVEDIIPDHDSALKVVMKETPLET